LMQKPFHKIEIYDAFIIKERNKPQQIRAVWWFSYVMSPKASMLETWYPARSAIDSWLDQKSTNT
jgi:hypothetical protein